MAVSHVKSNTIGDFTGTVTVLNSQGSTTTAAATNLVRPGDWNSAHNFYQTITGATAGQSTASGTNLVLGFENGMAGRVSTAAGVATLWIGPQTLSGYNPYPDQPMVTGQLGQGTLQFDPHALASPCQYDRLLFPVNYSGATNSTATLTVSLWWGLYTRTGSSISLSTSTSTSTTIGHSGTGAGSWTLHSGMRLLSVPMTHTVLAGNYVVGVVSRTSTSSQAVSISNFVGSNINSNFVGIFGASHNTTQQYTLGQGVYSTTTSGMPGSVGYTQIRGSDSQALRPLLFMFGSGTI